MTYSYRLKKWRILDADGVWHEVAGHFCFNNNDDGRGLVIRRYADDNPRNNTDVVASFAPGHWLQYLLVQDND